MVKVMVKAPTAVPKVVMATEKVPRVERVIPKTVNPMAEKAPKVVKVVKIVAPKLST